MRDQAEQLRQIVSTLQLNRKIDNTGYIGSTRVITITSGKEELVKQAHNKLSNFFS